MQTRNSIYSMVIGLALISLSAAGQQHPLAQASKKELPARPANDPRSPVMLAGDWVPADTRSIDFEKIPRVPANFRVISDVRATNGVNQHNYLAWFAGRFWCMWSDGPGLEDRAGQRVKYATSTDGLSWSQPRFLTPLPPGADNRWYYGTRTNKAFRYIARGFWQREGVLYALVALDEAGGFFGPGLQLRAYRLDTVNDAWKDAGILYENAINNFAPDTIGTGEWMMSRRQYDYKKSGVAFLIGGRNKINEWRSYPVFQTADALAAEEPGFWMLPDKKLVALFRDNKRSGFLYRSFSADNGHTWSTPVQTNFPDASSKFCGLRLKDGRYILVSNANPAKRDPLVISISNDGVVFDKMVYLTGGRQVDYPHVIEHDGSLLIVFSGEKQSVEVLKVRLSDLDQIRMKPGK